MKRRFCWFITRKTYNTQGRLNKSKHFMPFLIYVNKLNYKQKSYGNFTKIFIDS